MSKKILAVVEAPSATAMQRRNHQASIQPRLLDRRSAAAYLSVSEDMIDRLIHTGALHVVRLPAENPRSARIGLGVPGRARRVLLDIQDLDALIDRSRERSE